MVSPLEESVTVAEAWIDEQIAYATTQPVDMTTDCLLRLLGEVRNLLTNIRVTMPPKGGA